MKRLALFFAVCIFMMPVSAFAEDDITVLLNGDILETPVEPQLVNDRTMLPMRAIFEALGARVSWFEGDKIIFATKGDTMITLQIGVAKLSVQSAGNQENRIVPLETAPYIVESYTLVPVRAVAESLRAKVDWIDETQTVVITTD